MREMFEDVKLVIRTRKLREYNGQKKKDNRIKKDIRNHYTQNNKFNNANFIETGMN
jgi:hypothetical protein